MDLNGLVLLDVFFEHKIDSLKIEGRMRSPLYAGMISRVYREAIDAFASSGELKTEKINQWQAELRHLPHRAYTEASLLKPAGRSSVHDHPSDDSRTEPHYLGLIRKVVPNQYAVIEVKAGFSSTDSLEVISQHGAHLKVIPPILNSLGEIIDRVNPSSLIRIGYQSGMIPGQILRKQKGLWS